MRLPLDTIVPFEYVVRLQSNTDRKLAYPVSNGDSQVPLRRAAPPHLSEHPPKVPRGIVCSGNLYSAWNRFHNTVGMHDALSSPLLGIKDPITYENRAIYVMKRCASCVHWLFNIHTECCICVQYNNILVFVENWFDLHLAIRQLHIWKC